MQTATLDVLDGCKNLASLLVVVGVGDGELVGAILADRCLAAKDLLILVLPGEKPPAGLSKSAKACAIPDWPALEAWAYDHFAHHQDVVRLAGGDFVLPEGLSPQAQAFRDTYWPRAQRILRDRPWCLGNDINDTFMGFHHACLNAEAVLKCPSIAQVMGCLGQTPAISVGAGPSVREHIDNLRALQNKCLIVACDAVYPALVKEGIIPHIVTPLERLRQQAPLVKSAKGTRTIFAGIAACHPTTVEPFDGRAIYLHSMDRLYDWLSPREQARCLTGSSTGVLSFLVAASLTRGPVYLVGHDLGKEEDGAHHFDGCDLATKAYDAESKNAGGLGENGYEEREIPGNSGKNVKSIMWWDTFRGEIAMQASLIKGRVFNVNAHTKRYAVIENTLGAPLPDAGGLPDMAEIRVQRSETARYEDWRGRANKLGEDTESFLAAMGGIRTTIKALMRRHPSTWDLTAIMAQMVPETGVSDGNAAAFQYFLRSAFYNEQSLASWKARGFLSKDEAIYRTGRSLDGLAATVINAVEHLRPVLQAVSHG